MKYGDRIIKMEGVIVEICEGNVAIDLKGRLGYLKAPMRMLITEYPLKVGQEVAWDMSFVEQLAGPEVDVKPVENLETIKGTVCEVHDGCVASDFEDGLGFFKTPMRMVITDYWPAVGQTVAWNMTSIRQLGPEVNDKYVSNLDVYNRRQAEMRAKNQLEN